MYHRGSRMEGEMKMLFFKGNVKVCMYVYTLYIFHSPLYNTNNAKKGGMCTRMILVHTWTC